MSGIVVRDFAAGHTLAAETFHRAHGGGRGTCEACLEKASHLLDRLVQVTPEELATERYPKALDLGRRWVRQNAPTETTEVWDETHRGLRVIRSEALQDDGRWWAHVSVSRRDRKLPTWEQMAELKRLFLGDVEAYMVHPPEARYVNIAQVLHWFACLDEPGGVLPDFTRGAGTI